MRASVAGWNVAASVIGAVIGLVLFGVLAQAGTRFDATRAALCVFIPALAFTALFALLPETRGREPEDLWPDEETAPEAA